MRLWFCRKSWEGLASLYFSPCGYTERRWLPVNQESIRARTGVFCWHLDLEFLSWQTCRKIILLVHLLSETMLAFWILPSIKYKMPFTGSCLHTRTPAELLIVRGSGLMRRWDAAEAGWSQEARPSGFIFPGLFMFPSLCFLTAIRWTALLHTSSFSIAVMLFFTTDPQQAAPNVHWWGPLKLWAKNHPSLPLFVPALLWYQWRSNSYGHKWPKNWENLFFSK